VTQPRTADIEHQYDDDQREGKRKRYVSAPGRFNAFLVHRVTGLAHAQVCLANADEGVSADSNAFLPGFITVREYAVAAAEVLGDQTAAGIAEDPHVARGNIGIANDNIIVVSTADKDVLLGEAEALNDLTTAGKDFDPDHLEVCAASRKRFP